LLEAATHLGHHVRLLDCRPAGSIVVRVHRPDDFTLAPWSKIGGIEKRWQRDRGAGVPVERMPRQSIGNPWINKQLCSGISAVRIAAK